MSSRGLQYCPELALGEYHDAYHKTSRQLPYEREHPRHKHAEWPGSHPSRTCAEPRNVAVLPPMTLHQIIATAMPTLMLTTPTRSNDNAVTVAQSCSRHLAMQPQEQAGRVRHGLGLGLRNRNMIWRRLRNGASRAFPAAVLSALPAPQHPYPHCACPAPLTDRQPSSSPTVV